MENSVTSLPKPLNRSVWLVVVFGSLGFLDATYLALKYYAGTPITCGVFEGCETVTTSQYATIGPMPVALLGVFYYLIILLVAIAYLDIKRVLLLDFLARFTIVGFVASFWFLYLQLFVIRAICVYCVGSVLTSFVLFGLGRMMRHYQRSKVT